MAGILKSRLSEPQDIQDSPELQEEQEIDTEAENSINEEAASRHKKNKKKQKAVSRFAAEKQEDETDIPKTEGVMTEEDVRDLEELENMMSEELSEKNEKKQRHFQMAGQIVLSIACAYLVMLIFGALITEYHYGDSGEVEPIILSVEQIKEKNEFNTILSLYTQEKTLYERILVLDYRIAAGQEDTLTIAPEYEEALDTISILATQIEGADIASAYNQVSSLMLTWVQTHLAVYCQYMSTAITTNDSDAASEAIAARSVVYSVFQTITQNIVTLGEEIEVFDMTEIENWSPETYISETIEGVS